VYQTQEEGYGNWEKVKQAIRKDPEFRFDYFLRVSQLSFPLLCVVDV
jgi:hypothetical protein